MSIVLFTLSSINTKKAAPPLRERLLFRTNQLQSVLLHLSEALAAVDRTVCTGLERNFAGTAAGSAYSVKHLALAALAVVGSTFAGITAGFAALRLIGEALFSKKLLLVGGEGEFLSAIFADDRFVLEHVVPL